MSSTKTSATTNTTSLWAPVPSSKKQKDEIMTLH